MNTDTPKVNAVEYNSKRVMPERMAVDAEWARGLEREAAKLRTELENIANAKPHEWGDERDQFQAWAQSRARHALANTQLRNAGGGSAQPTL